MRPQHQNRRRALVTGGAGFLGSHMCDRLIAEGCDIVCLDNLLTGQLDNIQHLLAHPKFEFVQASASEPFKPSGSFDYVLHMASPASPRDYSKHPIETLTVGSTGTHRALELAQDNDAQFLLTSTSEVYGNPTVTPQPETYWGNVNPVGPRSMYDEAKRYAEALTMAYNRQYQTDTRIARIFNTYGPRMRVDDGRALPSLMSSAIRGEPLEVWGNGTQTRSFCYVDDLIEGLYRLLTVDQNSLGPDPIINLGNPQEITILNLAQEIKELTKTKSRILFQPLPQDDPEMRKPDIERASKILGWKPKVSREDGLGRVFTYFRELLESRNPSEQDVRK